MKQEITNRSMSIKYRLKFIVLVLVFGLLSVNLCMGATVTFYDNIPAAQSATDAITDCFPKMSTSYVATYAQFTDGLMSSSYFSYKNPETYIYVLGVADTNVYVSQVDIWIGAGDGSRDGFDFDIAFSSNGVTYTDIITGTHNPPSTGSDWNLGRFQFDPDETRGMSHISITSRGLPNSPRIAEIDVFTVPEKTNYTRSYSTGIDLDQSFTDAVNGVTPTVSSGSYYPNSALTDAESATSPSTLVYHHTAYLVVTNHWDLGTLKDGTFLDRVDVWKNSGDTMRMPARFGVIVSSDGTTWRDVADTGYRASTNTLSNDLLSIDFDSGAITDFRYVGIIDYPGESAGRHVQIREIDIFTDSPKGTVLIVR